MSSSSRVCTTLDLAGRDGPDEDATIVCLDLRDPALTPPGPRAGGP
ncbi:hypothetical protein CLV37_1112 [Kineococcus rhizosphaerae]|uniref:Uncharacterized protein n=1 Tax=Kineococcus rhizosphaerae TaxID=559628 RepID=A0A2T0QZC0_9ACTN|nr:hypothetical protein CLV37_1112 [Kineococcus rhizosphaerae]